MKKANYLFWKNCKEWTFSETFFLIKGLEPQNWEEIKNDPSLELHAEWSTWIKWARRYSGQDDPILFDDWFYESRPHEELLNWANSLEGIEVHEMWDDLYKSEDSPSENLEPGERARENLMATIGILALALVEATGPETGTKLKPKIAAIVRRCESVAGFPPGLRYSTMRNRIREGIYACMEKQDIAS